MNVVIGIVFFLIVVDYIIVEYMFMFGIDVDIVVNGVYGNNVFCFVIFRVEYYVCGNGVVWFMNIDWLLVDINLIGGDLCFVKYVFY